MIGGIIGAFGSGGSGSGVVPAPASAIGGFRREHLIIDGSGFVTGISDAIGDGSWFSVTGNVQGHVGIGIITDSFNAGSIFITVDGFDGTQSLVMRLRESGTPHTVGVLLSANSGDYAATYQQVGSSHGGGSMTVDGIQVRHDDADPFTDLGASPTRQQMWDALGINVSVPSSKTLLIELPQEVGDPTLQPGYYPNNSFMPKMFIEGMMPLDNTAGPTDFVQAADWLAAMPAYVGDPFNTQVTSMSTSALFRIPQYTQQVTSMSTSVLLRSPQYTQQVTSMSLSVLVRSP